MPRGKNRPLLIIDRRPPIPIGGVVPASDPAPAGRTAGSPEAPSNLALDDGIELVGAIYRNFIDATWDAPASFTPDYYRVAITDAASGTEYRDADHDDDPDGQQGVHLPNLKSGTLYTIKVRSVSASGAMSDWTADASITTETDSTPPGIVTSLSANYTTADLIVGWTTPGDGDLRDCLISIWESSSKVVTYLDNTPVAVKPSATGRFVWTLPDNKRAAGYLGDPSVYIEVKARDVAGNLSAAANTTATNAAPGNVSGLTSQFVGRDCLLAWTASTDSDLQGYRVTIDSVVQPLTIAPSFTYTFDANRRDHSGTPDPVLSVSVVAVDVFSQVSATAATTTATNPAPDPPTAVSIEAGVTVIIFNVTATIPSDFLAFRYRVIKDGGTVKTFDSATAYESYTLDGRATFQVGAQVVDAFGQASTETLSAVVSVDPLTLEYLRALAAYSGTHNTYTQAVWARLKDNSTANDIAISQTSLQYTQQEWPWTEVIRTVSLAGYTNPRFFLAFSIDLITWRWYAGPVTSGVLTEVANQAAAESAIVTMSSTITRYDLPAQIQARYIRLYTIQSLAAPTAPYAISEFYARRLVQSDDIEAEAIRALNIAAGAVTVDKLTIPGTASIDAALRLIAFRVPVSLDVNSGIYQGSGTFASPTTGLKLWNDSGTGRLAGYNSGTVQAELATDGKIKAGGNTTVLDSRGPSTYVSTSYDVIRSYNFRRSDETIIGAVRGFDNGSSASEMQVYLPGNSGYSSYLRLVSDQPAGNADARALLSASRGGVPVSVLCKSIGSGSAIEMTGAAAYIVEGVNVGTATGAAAGELRASGNVGIGGGENASVRLGIKGAGTSGATYGIVTYDSAFTTRFYVTDSGVGYLHATSWSFGPSNRALKENIRDVDPVGDVAKLRHVRPVRFDYKDGGRKNNVGFVAEELSGQFPDLVEQQPDGTAAIRTGDLIPLLLAGYKEQAQEIEQLHTEVQQLRESSQTMQDELAALRNDLDTLRGRLPRN